MSAKDAADDALDAALRELSYELLGPKYLNKDRQASEYRALFPSGTLDFISGPDRAEIAHVRAMVAYLSAHADHPMAARAPDLAEKAEALDARLEAASKAEAQYHAALRTEREQRSALGRTLRKSAWLLREHFDGDESKVDTLFPSVAEATVQEEPSTATV